MLLASTALSGASYAQDTWTGLYVGASGGFAWLDADSEKLGNPRPDVSVDGFLFGVQAGYNMQLDKIVLGVEGDIAFSEADGNGYWFLPSGRPYNIDMNYLSTIRGRAGMAFGETDNTLLYVTAGLAVADFDRGGANITHSSRTHTGFVVGLGAEHMLTDRISISAEYDYLALGKETYSTGETVKFGGSTVEIGVNFHF